MPKIKLVTWNINSVRLRAPLVQKLIESQAPDIICLQETKCPDELFPEEAFTHYGYAHIHKQGMKGYNGVAILSKLPFQKTDIYHRAGREDCRHISVNVAGFDLHNLYVPAGGDEPDRNINEKFGHKLDFVDELSSWFGGQYKKDNKVIAVGDFNIAPREHDVWSHKQLLKVVSHTPIEVEKLTNFYETLPWEDAIRNFVDDSEKCYSWWSYRNRDWKKSNRGRRLDHIWITRPLLPCLQDHEILIEARDWEKPSDHVPVMIDLAL